MKFAINTATYFGDAIINMLDDNGFDLSSEGTAFGESGYILVNTAKGTYRDATSAGNRATYNPATDWSAIAALVSAADGGAQAVSPAGAVANGNYAMTLPTPAAIIPVDAAGNPLAVGDTVLVVVPESRKAIFNLFPNGVAIITSITAKGALGFAFDGENQFLAKRFRKVSLSPAAGNVLSGDLVVAKARRDGRFALPQDTALTFRGLTQDRGSFILDGYAADQYAGKRFQKVSFIS